MNSHSLNRLQEQPRTAQSSISKWAVVLRLLMTIVLILPGAGLTYFAALPYGSARALANHLSRDGSLDRFTPALDQALQLPVLVTGLALIVAGITLALFPARGKRYLQLWVKRCAMLWKQMGNDTKAFLISIRRLPLQKIDAAFIALITTGAALLRVLFLARRLTHDEAYTYVAFASRPWLAVISDYHLPNNHIFHSILVKISTSIFGPQLWAVRLPALLAGVMCILVAYVLAKQLYGRWTAVLAASLIAALPITVLYSTIARGYSLYMLFTLVLAALALYLKENRNRAGWLIFVLVASLGFYTLPMMVYPFGGILVWMLASAILGDYDPSYESHSVLLRYIFTAGAGVVLLTTFLYLPVLLIGTGWNSLVANSFVERLSLDQFFDSLRSGVEVIAREWRADVPGWLWALLLLGFCLSLLFHRRTSRVKVPLQLALLAWLAVILILQRPNVIARVWTFLIPLFAIWSAAGLVELLARIKVGTPGKLHAGMLVSLAGLLFLGSYAYRYAHTAYPEWKSYPDRIELVVQFLQPRLQQEDMLVISSMDGPALWYYAGLYGIPSSTYDRLEQAGEHFQRAFIVVSQHEGQTLLSAIEARGLDPTRFDLATAALIYDLDGVQAYECKVD